MWKWAGKEKSKAYNAEQILTNASAMCIEISEQVSWVNIICDGFLLDGISAQLQNENIYPMWKAAATEVEIVSE